MQSKSIKKEGLRQAARWCLLMCKANGTVTSPPPASWNNLYTHTRGLYTYIHAQNATRRRGLLDQTLSKLVVKYSWIFLKINLMKSSVASAWAEAKQKQSFKGKSHQYAWMKVCQSHLLSLWSELASFKTGEVSHFQILFCFSKYFKSFFFYMQVRKLPSFYFDAFPGILSFSCSFIYFIILSCLMNFSMKVRWHDFVSEQCKWNCPLMVWNLPSWPLKGDNWKIQDEATVKVGTLGSRSHRKGRWERKMLKGNVICLNLKFFVIVYLNLVVCNMLTLFQRCNSHFSH